MSQTVPLSTGAVAVVDAEIVEPDEDFTREQAEAAAMADGLRQLARLVETNPQFVDALSYALRFVMAPINDVAEPRRLLAEVSRATLAAGGKVDKYYNGDYAGILACFGPVRVQVYAGREEVCERVVLGTREVTTEVADPDALAAVPKVKVTETVEDVEWRCTPILAGDTGQAAA